MGEDGLISMALLAPACPYVPRRDALTWRSSAQDPCPRIITNPPWARPLLHALIEHFATQADEAWLLFDSSWAQTAQAVALGQRYCTDIVAAGRLKWFEGSGHDATDDCSWYRFSADKAAPTRYHWPSPRGRDQRQGLLL